VDPNVACHHLMGQLRLSAPPVGVALLETVLPPEAPPPIGLQRFCCHVSAARLGHQTVGLRLRDLECLVSQCVLSLGMLPAALVESGELGPEAAVWADRVSCLPAGSVKSIVVGPLDALPVSPTVVLVLGTAPQIAQLAHSEAQRTGRRVRPSLMGLAAGCSGAVARVARTGAPACLVPSPCMRRRGLFALDELIYAMPFPLLEATVRALQGLTVAEAPLAAQT